MEPGQERLPAAAGANAAAAGSASAPGHDGEPTIEKTRQDEAVPAKRSRGTPQLKSS